MRTSSIGIGLIVVLLPSAAMCQEDETIKKRLSTIEDVAKDYNKKIQPINEALNALTKKLDDPTMSMSDAAKVIAEKSEIQKQADALWKTTQDATTTYRHRYRETVDEFNTNNRTLDYSTTITNERIDGLNTIPKYKTKDAFDKDKEANAKSWDEKYGTQFKKYQDEFKDRREEIFKRVKDSTGIDLPKEGYQQIGVVNPYTGEKYYKYYDKDGNLQAGVWTDDAKGTAKWQKDVEQYRKRQKWLEESLQKSETSLGDFSKSFDSSRSEAKKVFNEVRRVDFTANWSGKDNLGNPVTLVLNKDGTMRYSFTERAGSYSNNGTWVQSGRLITATTNDGRWKLRSSITKEDYLSFTETRTEDGKRYENYLKR